MSTIFSHKMQVKIGNMIQINILLTFLGNCAIVKPSEVGQNFGQLLAKVIPKYTSQVVILIDFADIRHYIVLIESQATVKTHPHASIHTHLFITPFHVQCEQ